MKRITLKSNSLRTLDWFNGNLIDWNSAGTAYFLNGEIKQTQKYHFGFVCDGSITSSTGEYAVIYQKRGTKALLLRNGEVWREINRSYYQSDVYEFPIAFFDYKEKTYLIHCPFGYNRLDFEDVETGEIITKNVERNPQDFFHSRLEVSPDNKHFMSKGWVWHPFDVIKLYDIEKCFENAVYLDNGSEISNNFSELCSGSFINNDLVLVCSTNESFDEDNEGVIQHNSLSVWDFKNDKILSSVKINATIGNVFAIDKEFCWDLYQYPKIINIKSGEIIDELKDINSGEQSSSIIHHLEYLPKIAFNRNSKQIAINQNDTIEILTKE
jgi:hypothetical protein